MRAVANKLGMVLCLALLAPALLPAGNAAPPDFRAGVHAEITFDHMPPGWKASPVNEAKLTPGGIMKHDLLVLDRETYDELMQRPEMRQALQRFVEDHRVLTVVGGEGLDLTPFGLRNHVGQDIPMVDGEEAEVQGRGHGLYVGPTGAVHTYAIDYAEARSLSADFARSAAEWVTSRPDFQVSASLGHARAGDWSFVDTATYQFARDPYGKVGYDAAFFREISETSLTYDWWNVMMTTITNPGWYAYGSDWTTHRAFTWSDTDYYEGSGAADHELVNWGTEPSRVNAKEAVTLTSGMIAGVDGAPITSTQSVGYYSAYTSSTPSSSKDSDYYWLRRTVDEYTEYRYEPQGWDNIFTVRLPEGECLKIPYTNKAQWQRNGISEWYQTYINSWREFCPL